MLEQKYPKSLIEASILRAKKMPLETLRQTKAAKSEKIISFFHYYIQSQQSKRLYNKTKLWKLSVF